VVFRRPGADPPRRGALVPIRVIAVEQDKLQGVRQADSVQIARGCLSDPRVPLGPGGTGRKDGLGTSPNMFAFATVRESPDTPWQPPLEEFPPSRFRVSWGQALDREDARYLDPTEAAWLLQIQRGTSTPSARSVEVELWRHTNTVSLLPAIRVPTLVLQDRDGTSMSVAQNGRFFRERIPNATLIEHDGDDQLWWYAPAGAIVREVRRFTASLDKHDLALTATSQP
jgi:pimeloyl-ACP methyl ester carboxylesterase